MNYRAIIDAGAFVLTLGVCAPVLVWAMFFGGSTEVASSIVVWTFLGGSASLGVGLGIVRAIQEAVKEAERGDMKSPMMEDDQRKEARQLGKDGPSILPGVGRVKPVPGCPCSVCVELAVIIEARGRDLMDATERGVTR